MYLVPLSSPGGVIDDPHEQGQIAAGDAEEERPVQDEVYLFVRGRCRTGGLHNGKGSGSAAFLVNDYPGGMAGLGEGNGYTHIGGHGRSEEHTSELQSPA